MAIPAFPTLDVLPPPPGAKNVLPRSAIPAGDCLCDHCIGKCCRYFSMPIRQPANWDDFHEVRGYLAHERTMVYVESGTWFLLVTSRCHYLTAEDRCRIYHDRPRVCREYTADECEYDDDWIFERLFEAPEQVDEYAEAILPPSRAARSEAAIGPLTLPIREPLTWDDFDEVRWFLAHERTMVYVESGTWYLRIMTGRRSPQDVHGRNAADCRQDSPELGRGETFERAFETAEQVWEYAEATLPPRRVKRTKPAIAVIADAPPGDAPLAP